MRSQNALRERRAFPLRTPADLASAGTSDSFNSGVEVLYELFEPPSFTSND